MTDRTARLEQLVDEIRSAELALEVARLAHDAAELEAAERHLERLRERHARESGWLVEATE
jgi:exonuclease VII small subunit